MKLPIGSIWRKTNHVRNKIPSYPKLSGNGPEVDVCIVGGGVFGLQTALKLQENGKSVAVIEADKIASGVSSHTTAKVTCLHNVAYSTIENKFGPEVSIHYARMNMAGLNEIKRNISTYDIDCEWEDSHSYTIALDSDELDTIKEEMAALKRAGLETFLVTPQSISNEIPFANKGAICLPNQGIFNSYDYCIGIVKALEKNGAYIYEDSRVQDVDYSQPHTVQTDEGNVLAQKVVIATHLPILNRSGHWGVVTPTSSYCVAFEMQDGVEAPLGHYITKGMYDEFGGKSVRRCCKGKVLVIAGNSHKTGEFPPTGNSEDLYKNLIDFGKKYFKVKDVICCWSGLDYVTADYIPYIGHLHHGINTLYTATGFKKWGFTTSAGAAMIVSDMICGKKEGETATWANTFDARRWDLAHSTVSMMKFQAHVSKHFVATRIRDVIKAKDIEDLVNDEGGICKHGMETVAAYRDKNGEFHLFSASCSHLGCHLDWNAAEQTFDCSCHGSRFSAMDGSVLHGPATKPLPPVPSMSSKM
nr:unnamed protein product [Naegleria fowleri]